MTNTPEEIPTTDRPPHGVTVKRLVMRLRECLDLIDHNKISDDELLIMTKGTWIRAAIELEIAFDGVGVCIKNEIDEARRKMTTGIESHIRKIFGA